MLIVSLLKIHETRPDHALVHPFGWSRSPADGHSSRTAHSQTDILCKNSENEFSVQSEWSKLRDDREWRRMVKAQRRQRMARTWLVGTHLMSKIPKCRAIVLTRVLYPNHTVSEPFLNANSRGLG